MKKKTLVIGGSSNPNRYSNKAIRKLLKEDKVESVNIVSKMIDFENVNTVTMYLGAQRQPQYYDYIIGLKPKRIIFNPGTENEEFALLAKKNGIEVVENCTLVMLDYGMY